jgi:maltose alpha-D-glucosyltransferase/alpha-amylase
LPPDGRAEGGLVGLYDQWYKNAIIYCVDVETFADSNGDGIGDFIGLIDRLDYIASLGITCIWLMPFYPTPNRDDGYDITDYTAIDPRFGTLADFAEFMLEARERGLHVITDLVPNHTSDQHPWFKAARLDPKSPYRAYYVWRTDDPGDTSSEVVFPGEQEGIWSWDKAAKAWYLHHFYPFQPNLHFANPEVREEFRKIIGLWLQYGVSGFRIDAAPFLTDPSMLDGAGDLEHAHRFLRELRDYAIVRSGNAVLFGEVDVGLTTLADYFGGGTELQALFNFTLTRFVFLGLAQESADPIKFGLGQMPTIPQSGQWINFLRHHDELNLARLTKEQREQILDAFAPDPDMQIYNRGLRRRLATMFKGDPARLRLAYSLLFGLPGSPMIFYGEEIGMGENLSIPGRLSVRTPMQWTSYAAGGFSTAEPESYVRPMTDGPYGYRQVSVGRQRSDPDALLNWMAALIRTRRECSEMGTGSCRLIELGTDQVLGIRYNSNGSEVIVLNNLSGRRARISLDLNAQERSRVTELLCDRPYKPLDEADGQITLNPYGYRWIRLGGIY